MPFKELRVSDALLPSRNMAVTDLLRFGRVPLRLRCVLSATPEASSFMVSRETLRRGGKFWGLTRARGRQKLKFCNLTAAPPTAPLIDATLPRRISSGVTHYGIFTKRCHSNQVAEINIHAGLRLGTMSLVFYVLFFFA
jgi:hypothetical protein